MRKKHENYIEKMPGFIPYSTIPESGIEMVEDKLHLRLAEEYKQILLEYGAVKSDKVVLNGVGVCSRFNVVDQTMQQRILQHIPDNCYVLETVKSTGILVLQDESGKVYQFVDGSTTKYADSIKEYVIKVYGEEIFV